MGLTGFNRARQQAADRVHVDFDRMPYDKAVEVLAIPGSDADEPTVPDLVEARRAELLAMPWQSLRNLFKAISPDEEKPEGVSWDEFAVPKILEHEGLG